MTGYNGAGKSRIISIISEAFSVAGDGKFNSSVSRWAFEADLSNGSKVRALKMEVGGASKDDIESLGKSYNDVDVDLSEMYQSAAKMVAHRSKTRYTTDSDQDSEQHFCISGGFIPNNLPSVDFAGGGNAAQVNMVSFIDESLYFNFPLNGAEAALEGKTIESNIDKTLWLLIHAYISKRLNQSQMNAVLSKLGSFEKDGVVDFSSDAVQSLLRVAVQELKESSDLENAPVFSELNKFYGMTNRKLVWREDTFQMIVPGEGVIPFISFSKGEKTLLALLLTVSLYGDSAVFLLDEPDLSLHVEWQRMLLPAMLRLAPESQFIIGTHSPFLVMNTQSETVVNLAKKFKEDN
ncbi:hypothetical protein CP335_20460 [Pseudomonas fluorescens]|uniref:ATPase AAA-type core domain-containing protein n=2 Tax=Pseudomonas fluorescens TaxID=294 RepID=A0A854WWB3_PSEFL|nr:hypothetical protein CP335_20460 [Pseudomonas fluorescens]